MKFRKFSKLKTCTEPLCGEDIPEGKLPPVKWFCAKLNMFSTDFEELRRLNGNCPGCIVEAHEIGECKANPHRKTG